MTIEINNDVAKAGQLREKFLMALGVVEIIADVIAHPFVRAFRAVVRRQDSTPSLAQRIMGPYL